MEKVKYPAKDPAFAQVAFTCQTAEPNDGEIRDMIDELLSQLFGSRGLRAVVKPGDHVVIKTNIVMCCQGARGEKGRAVITDPRITRYVAEKVREIIGWDGDADLKVVDACFSPDPNPSNPENRCGFHWARLNRAPDNTVSPEDICCDYDCDGYLDGPSRAQLVNLDAIGPEGRDLHTVRMADGREVKVAFPRFLRTREEGGEGEFTDVLIGLPVFKNHWYVGVSGALKLHYGFRSLPACLGDTGRRGHEGFYTTWENGKLTPHHLDRLQNYLAAEHRIRTYDLVIMDCLTANRDGPGSPSGAVSYSRDIDEKVDYITTHSLLASRDAVAIDTVETAFAGYRPESVGLTKVAAENGVGICDPAHILMLAGERFKFQKLRLAEAYGAEGKYPLSASGNPVVEKGVGPKYTVTITDFTRRPDADGLLHVRYAVTPAVRGTNPDICRVDLVIAGEIVRSYLGGGLLENEFTFRYADYDTMHHAYLVGMVCAWDSSFNCVPSYSEFFIPPAEG